MSMGVMSATSEKWTFFFLGQDVGSGGAFGSSDDEKVSVLSTGKI